MGLGVLALVASVIGVVTTAWDKSDSIEASFFIQQGASALGHLAPYLAVLSVLVEPARFRAFAYLGILAWAGASVLLALDNAYSLSKLVGGN